MRTSVRVSFLLLIALLLVGLVGLRQRNQALASAAGGPR